MYSILAANRNTRKPGPLADELPAGIRPSQSVDMSGFY